MDKPFAAHSCIFVTPLSVFLLTLYGPCLPELNTMDGWMDGWMDGCTRQTGVGVTAVPATET